LKRGKLLAALIVISISLLPLVPPQSTAQVGYTEKLTVYVAGSNAAWFVSLGQINATGAHLTSAEAIASLTSYNLTAIKTTSWTADFQVFGPQGYNVLPVPFVPPQGVFLSVGASSFADASSAAGRFGSYLLTSFESISNRTGSYSFFAPVSFASVIPSTLLSLLPLGNGGFLAPIIVSKFVGLSSPIVTLSGQKVGSGFTHELTIGSISSSGLDSTSKPSILNFFGQAVASLQASNKSSSSTIELHFLDGLVVSSDSAAVTNNRAAFSSSYTLSLKPGSKVSKLNSTIIQQPPALLATRLVDVGVLKPGSNMSVTISLNNLSNSSAIQGVSVNDSWWRSAGHFKLVSGSSDILVPSLGAGQSNSPTYVLQYTGNATQQLALPATSVSYSYVVGTSQQSGHAKLNPVSLSLGADGPVVYSYLTSSGTLGGPVGWHQSLKVVLRNVGTRAANSVIVGGRQVGGLASNGGSATVPVSATAPSLTAVNVSKSYQVSYTTPGGQSVNLTTNSLPVIFSHTGMKIGFATLALNATLSHLSGGSGYNLLVTLDVANKGSANVTSFVARSQLPSNLPCGNPSASVACNGRSLTLSYPLVGPNGNQHASIGFNVTQPSSFIFWPAAFSLVSAGYSMTGFSNGQPAPTGVIVSKQFNPSDVFPSMTSQVAAIVRNSGPYSAYNATVSTTADAFDSISGNPSTFETTQTLAPGSNITLSYGVIVGSATGSPTAVPASASFFMGGTRFSVSSPVSAVRLNKLPAATIVTSPTTPTEGSQFTITVTITNPAAVGVANVQFLLPVPSGVKVSSPTNATFKNSALSISIGGLAAGASYSAQAGATASSGQTIPFSSAKLTFGFAGATISGRLPPAGIAIGESVSTRYLVPFAIAVLAVLAIAYEVRRIAGATAPSSPK
jgi:hypothetical protein